MRMFFWNIVLALVWTFGIGDFRLANFVLGFVAASLVLGFAQRIWGETSYHGKAWKTLRFAGTYLWQLLLANLRVAYDVLTPTHHMRPGIIAVPLDAKTDLEITLLANLITLTPGTLSLGVNADRTRLFVHSMYLGDVEEDRQSIKRDYEAPVLELLR